MDVASVHTQELQQSWERVRKSWQHVGYSKQGEAEHSELTALSMGERMREGCGPQALELSIKLPPSLLFPKNIEIQTLWAFKNSVLLVC